MWLFSFSLFISVIIALTEWLRIKQYAMEP